jgi:hypothetical protein
MFMFHLLFIFIFLGYYNIANFFHTHESGNQTPDHMLSGPSPLSFETIHYWCFIFYLIFIFIFLKLILIFIFCRLYK